MIGESWGVYTPITPTRAQPRTPDPDIEVVPDTPSPVTKPGRSRGRGTWRAPQKPVPGVGTRSMTRLAEIEKRENEQAQTASAIWPASPDISDDIQQLTRKLHISDVPRKHTRWIGACASFGEDDTELTSRQPPAAGLISRQQDTYLIPPPSRAVGGVRGRLVSVSTATLGLIHRQDPALAGATSPGPRIIDVSTDQTQSLQHHAPHQNWHDLARWRPSNNGKRPWIAKTTCKNIWTLPLRSLSIWTVKIS